MKILSARSILSAGLLAGVFFLLGAGCTKQDRTDAGAKAKEVYGDSKAAMGKAWDSVKSHTFEKRGDFTATAKSLSSQMDAQVSKLNAQYSDAKASASRKAAMAELKSADADYKAKLAALGNASAATWDSAKNNTIAAWDRLEASYYKARAD